MNTSYGLNSYRAHDLNISMKTSSGDVIEMDFANHNSASISHEKNANGSKTSMTFSSMQSFQFSMKTNGIDAQDQKEIDAFMEIAQPFIDSFLKELENEAPSSPVSKLAHKIAEIFDPNRERNEDEKNNIKTNLVEMFDNSLKKIDNPQTIEKIFADAKKLLERTLQEFENFNKELYA